MLRYSPRRIMSLPLAVNNGRRDPFPGTHPLRLLLGEIDQHNHVDIIYHGVPSLSAWRKWELMGNAPPTNDGITATLYDKSYRIFYCNTLDGDHPTTFRRGTLWSWYFFTPPDVKDSTFFDCLPLRLREGSIYIHPRMEFNETTFRRKLRERIRGHAVMCLPKNRDVYPNLFIPPQRFGARLATPGLNPLRIPHGHHDPFTEDHGRLFTAFTELRQNLRGAQAPRTVAQILAEQAVETVPEQPPERIRFFQWTPHVPLQHEALGQAQFATQPLTAEQIQTVVTNFQVANAQNVAINTNVDFYDPFFDDPNI